MKLYEVDRLEKDPITPNQIQFHPNKKLYLKCKCLFSKEIKIVSLSNKHTYEAAEHSKSEYVLNMSHNLTIYLTDVS